ncbi:MAG: hypothetical protein LUF35_06830 [Lachnospiraceae bacterium]|nr:hypothetical protein [Lachnospiraceae bacterium]
MMKEELKFQTFFDQYDSEFTEYISMAGKPDVTSDQYRELVAEMNGIYEKYPIVRAVMDSTEPRSLTVEECEGLLAVVDIRETFWSMESEKIYFQGCADSIGYMRKLKMLKGQPD